MVWTSWSPTRIHPHRPSDIGFWLSKAGFVHVFSFCCYSYNYSYYNSYYYYYYYYYYYHITTSTNTTVIKSQKVTTTITSLSVTYRREVFVNLYHFYTSCNINF